MRAYNIALLARDGDRLKRLAAEIGTEVATLALHHQQTTALTAQRPDGPTAQRPNAALIVEPDMSGTWLPHRDVDTRTELDQDGAARPYGPTVERCASRMDLSAETVELVRR